jgi:ABC-type multidrug transport system fused ATPase/permease subunit
MLVGAVAELLTLGAILPFLAAIADASALLRYPAVGAILSVLGLTQEKHTLAAITALFAIIVLATACVRLTLAWTTQRFVFRLGHDLSTEAFRRAIHQPYSYHTEKNTSEIIAAISKVDNVLGFVLLPLMQALTGVIISAFILGALIVIDPWTALTCGIAFGLMYILVSIFIRRPLVRNSALISASWTARLKTIQEALGAIRDILIDGGQAVHLCKFSDVDSRYRDAEALNTFSGAAPRFIIEAFGMVVIALIALVVSQRSGGLAAALPALGALALGAQRLLPLLQLVYFGWTQATGNMQTIFDVLEVLNLPVPRLAAAATKVPSITFVREISLENVSFSYGAGHATVLRGVTLRIEKGSRVGFIGKTGCGKSTLLDIIMGLLYPTSGVIKVDGRELKGMSLDGWRTQIAHVPQSIYLSDASIAENIAFGVPMSEVNMPLVISAAKKAMLADFIDSLSNRYLTPVGERGVRLSGGQRQRIGLARALYKDAKVLVLDEATSALDMETEAEVMRSIEKLGPELTILVVAHRLSTLAMCDKIVQIDSGCVASEGPAGAMLEERAEDPALRALQGYPS